MDQRRPCILRELVGANGISIAAQDRFDIDISAYNMKVHDRVVAEFHEHVTLMCIIKDLKHTAQNSHLDGERYNLRMELQDGNTLGYERGSGNAPMRVLETARFQVRERLEIIAIRLKRRETI